MSKTGRISEAQRYQLRMGLGRSEGVRTLKAAATDSVPLQGCRHPDPRSGARCGAAVIANAPYCEEHSLLH